MEEVESRGGGGGLAACTLPGLRQGYVRVNSRMIDLCEHYCTGE